MCDAHLTPIAILFIEYCMEIQRGRPRGIEGGRTSAYYLGDRHRAALEAYRAKYGFKTTQAAMRSVLELVEDSLTTQETQ